MVNFCVFIEDCCGERLLKLSTLYRINMKLHIISTPPLTPPRQRGGELDF
ncbi:hypothetical protein NSP_35430 [Nodularia spumigena CCY9414]|nr:hypothetical protein NSP_35430 [Nodularia spumigena CCY9414]